MSFEFHFSEEVASARVLNHPIVALESTIISHGMPFPQNLEVAQEVENVVRANGAIPATIAIISGEIHVGLDQELLADFASRKNVMKCSRRDLSLAISEKLDGATTVAATMIIAEIAGIRIFATGGIGGVHRNAERTFDISADLTELSKTNVAVVSAGAKAILDIPKTLEYLETFGVPVIGFDTNDFPAFYSRKSGQKLHINLETPEKIASFLNAKWNLGINGGAVIANPIPVDDALDYELVEKWIREALVAADKNGVDGKELTPFLLKFLNSASGGLSQTANKSLVLNNAALAARIAFAYSEITP